MHSLKMFEELFSDQSQRNGSNRKKVIYSGYSFYPNEILEAKTGVGVTEKYFLFG